MSKAVYRFYGTPGIGANSHFFTAGPEECGLLRNGVGWTYEGRAFGAELPVGSACPPTAPVPVYRAYNMRWPQNDSNHRHTKSVATYQQMIARGWAGEGVAFCVPDN
jgi:serine protease